MTEVKKEGMTEGRKEYQQGRKEGRKGEGKECEQG
jgi:hypothetical protein